MKILIDIVHPAHVLFFKRPLEIFKSRGDDVLICSRYKDIACDLLDLFGFPHTPISTAASGALGLAHELIVRNMRMLNMIKSFSPDVMLGYGGVAISHCGVLTKTPSIAFYDTEVATMQTRITWPFITQLYVPDCYAGKVPMARTKRIAGVKELSYLHPSAFAPDRTKALAGGLSEDQPNYFLRVVSWRANHDIGKTGWSEDELGSLVEALSARGKVHLSSEAALPEGYEQYRYVGAPHEIHHLLAHCDLYVGESATMASEAAILGIPSIFAGRDFRGYIEELSEAGLVINAPDRRHKALTDLAFGALERSRDDAFATRNAYVAVCPDWALEVVKAAYQYEP